jgi:hypothetical protein
MNIYLKSTGGNILPNMLKYLNFNPNFPENFNILISDLSRENIKIFDGKKFNTKKFKNVKDEILNIINNHITTMCSKYMENIKIKKNPDILNKIRINSISVNLIINEDITSFFSIKKAKPLDNSDNTDNTDNSDDSDDLDDSDDSDNMSENKNYDYLDSDGEKKVLYYENKRLGLQEITTQKIKEELYNNKDLIIKYHKSIKNK